MCFGLGASLSYAPLSLVFLSGCRLSLPSCKLMLWGRLAAGWLVFPQPLFVVESTPYAKSSLWCCCPCAAQLIVCCLPLVCSCEKRGRAGGWVGAGSMAASQRGGVAALSLEEASAITVPTTISSKSMGGHQGDGKWGAGLEEEQWWTPERLGWLYALLVAMVPVLMGYGTYVDRGAGRHGLLLLLLPTPTPHDSHSQPAHRQPPRRFCCLSRRSVRPFVRPSRAVQMPG